MSGHSKWSQIKRKKGIKDEQKGKIFSKISRLITLAVKEGGGITDPEKNVKLRLAIEQAKKNNMPKDNIQRAIERAIKEEGEEIQETLFEAFAPGGVALLILATTDNTKRTLSEIKKVLDSEGGKLGSTGATSFLFQKVGLITFEKGKVNQEKILDLVDKIEALDFDEDEENFFVYIPFEMIGQARSFLSEFNYKSLEIDHRPISLVEVQDREIAKKILTIIEALESLDDVQKVFANFNIPDEFLK